MASKKKRASPADIVRVLSREELESLVLGRLEAGDAALGNVIFARYAKADGGEARELVHSLVEGHDEDGYGYVNDAEGLAGELGELRRRVGALKGVGDSARAFAILVAIVEEVAPRCWQGARSGPGRGRTWIPAGRARGIPGTSSSSASS